MRTARRYFFHLKLSQNRQKIGEEVRFCLGRWYWEISPKSYQKDEPKENLKKDQHQAFCEIRQPQPFDAHKVENATFFTYFSLSFVDIKSPERSTSKPSSPTRSSKARRETSSENPSSWPCRKSTEPCPLSKAPPIRAHTWDSSSTS